MMWRLRTLAQLFRIRLASKLHLVSCEAFSAVLSDHMIAERAEWRMALDSLDNIVHAQRQEIRQLRDTVGLIALKLAKNDVEAIERGTRETDTGRK